MAASYADKLKDPMLQKKRLEIMERDGWQCQCCYLDDEPHLRKFDIYNTDDQEVDDPTGIIEQETKLYF